MGMRLLEHNTSLKHAVSLAVTGTASLAVLGTVNIAIWRKLSSQQGACA